MKSIAINNRLVNHFLLLSESSSSYNFSDATLCIGLVPLWAVKEG